MKTLGLSLFLAFSALSQLFGQAPASVAGFTYRGPLNPGGIQSQSVGAIDLLADGTFAFRFSLSCAYNTRSGIYNEALGIAPGAVGGSYSYQRTSANQAVLTFLGSYSFTLSFNDTTGGQAASNNPNGFQIGSFSLVPSSTDAPSRALINISTLLSVQQGQPATIGFVIGGSGLREILIRSVGPGLAQFGVNNAVSNPEYFLNGVPNYTGNPFGSTLMPGESFQLFNAVGTGWSATTGSAVTIAAETAKCGAFPLLPGSNDKADVFLLPPGAYTIIVNPLNSAAQGVELIEVYDVE